METPRDPTPSRSVDVDERYLDEKAVRDEITRQFSVCVECRRCIDRCGVFPSLFDLVDAATDTDPGRLTPHEQDHVVDACHQCGQCVTDCPYTVSRSDLAVDIPALVLRARAMQRSAGHQPLRRRVAVALLAPPIPRPLAGSRPRSRFRRMLAAVVGVSSQPWLPPRAKHRFTTWFHGRTDRPCDAAVGSVAVVATCHLEHHHPEVGRDLVACYEQLGIGCAIADVVCCGAPLLHSGDRADFVKVAVRNVNSLVESIEAGARAVIVPQPACAHVLAIDTPQAVPGDDAELVAAHVRDPCGFLDELVASGEISLEQTIRADAPDRVVVHEPPPTPERSESPAARLLERLGIAATVVRGTSGTADTWGHLVEHEAAAADLAAALGSAIDDAAGGAPDDVAVVGSSLPDNDVIAERTGRRTTHPIQLVARIIGADRPR